MEINEEVLFGVCLTISVLFFVLGVTVMFIGDIEPIKVSALDNICHTLTGDNNSHFIDNEFGAENDFNCITNGKKIIIKGDTNGNTCS